MDQEKVSLATVGGGAAIDAVITLVMRSPIYGLMEPWCIMSLGGMMNYEEGGK